ncbi:hypothetical protein Hypma_005108 [Hypsizygus marmoreus]|uniref:N-acetyltransferase domain-containing protein n=1 Tax=Hypsizygus marmoreus TaxID=39966 RepID=A0A369K2L8_HYPMA|nr:hypothetical protein Hypma_005108 [Hypsizygus marmoreus]
MSEEKKPATSSPKPGFSVTPLRYRNVFNAARTFAKTGAPDPVVRYIRNNRNPTRPEQMSERLRIAAYLVLCIRTKIMLTVDKGIANVVGAPPQEITRRRDVITKIVQWITQVLRCHRDLTIKPEERERRKELEDKMSEAVKRTFGDRVDTMWYVESLCTDPEHQGRGYGGALLDSVTTLADWASQTTWLQSSNINNTAFYNMHGFVTVETVVLGDQNPTWNEAPVVVSIMVREPKSPSSGDAKVG